MAPLTFSGHCRTDARLRLCPNYELKPDGIGFILNLILKPNSTTGSAYSELTTDSIFKHRLGRHQ